MITPKFSEPMRVINEPKVGNGYVVVNLVGTRTQTFCGGVYLTNADLQEINVQEARVTFKGKVGLFLFGPGCLED